MSLSRNSTGRLKSRRRLKYDVLGELPPSGLTKAQVETVKEITESGVVTSATLTYHGKGATKVAATLGLAILTLQNRLAESRREIVETCQFRLEAIDPSKAETAPLLEYLDAQPHIERVADAMRDAFKEQIKKELLPLLPLPKQREGFTWEQIALVQKTLEGLGVGGASVAPIFGFLREPSIANRLEVMNLRIVGKCEYTLEKIEGWPQG